MRSVEEGTVLSKGPDHGFSVAWSQNSGKALVFEAMRALVEFRPSVASAYSINRALTLTINACILLCCVLVRWCSVRATVGAGAVHGRPVFRSCKAVAVSGGCFQDIGW